MSALAQLRELVAVAGDAQNLLERQLTGWPTTGERELLITRLAAAIAGCAPLEGQALTVKEFAGWCRVSAPTVRGWIEDGRLEAFNAGRGTVKRWRIPVAAALGFVAISAARGHVPRGTTEI